MTVQKADNPPHRYKLYLAAAIIIAAIIAVFTYRGQSPSGQAGPVVLAASSLQEAMTDAAQTWTAKGHPQPVLSFAASSTLARQINAGAPADLFVSADQTWMDYLAERGQLQASTRTNLVSNSLVLVAPRDSEIKLKIGPAFPLAQALGKGRLAIGDPAAVPAGTYAKEALKRLGVWPSVENQLAPAENVRTALMMVSRGETPLGIVYKTDAAITDKVKIVGTFPPDSHASIRYPIALIKGARNPDAAGFRAFLLSDEGQGIFHRYGFTANLPQR